MNYLLDTHVLLWWLADDPRLPEKIRNIIANPQNSLFLSSVVILEISLKLGIGKLEMPQDWYDRISQED